MSLNPSVCKIISELAQMKQWQSEQHERLVRQHEEQRQQFAKEQGNYHDLYGNANIRDEDADDMTQTLMNSFSDKDEEVRQLEVLYEESTISSSDSDKDDLSPRNEFNVPAMHHRNSEAVAKNAENSNAVTEAKRPAKPFLKRGSGLIRFGLTENDLSKQNQRIKACKGKPGANKTQAKRKVQSQRNVQMPPPVKENNNFKKPVVAKKQIVFPKAPVEQIPKIVLQTKPRNVQLVKVNDGKLTVSRASTCPTLQLEPEVLAKPLEPLATVPPQNTVFTSQSDTVVQTNFGHTWSTVLMRPTVACSSSADSTPVKVEQRELRMFERLERIAADSSFCSSSSVVTKFVEGGYISSVQSTPQVTPSKNKNPQVKLDLPSPYISNAVLDRAKALLESLAPYKLSNDDMNKPDQEGEIHLNLRPLQQVPGTISASDSEGSGDSVHVRFNDTPQIQEVVTNPEAWSEESSEYTDSSTEEETLQKLPPETVQPAQPQVSNGPALVSEIVVPHAHEMKWRSENRDEEDSDSCSTVSISTVADEDEEREVATALIHARLEQLETEVKSVQHQKLLLASQWEHLEEERKRLAIVAEENEAEKRKLQSQKNNVGGVTKKKNAHQEEIEQLKNQLEELQKNWKEREARWAAAQATQRIQIRQICQENKQLAFQIKQLKFEQCKKVRFAPAKCGRPLATSKPAPSILNTEITEQDNKFDRPESRRASISSERSESPKPHLPHLRTRSASPSVRIPSPEPETPKIKSLSDLDVMMTRFANLYDQSPGCSIVLDSHSKINNAYNAIFQDNPNVTQQSLNTTCDDSVVNKSVDSVDNIPIPIKTASQSTSVNQQEVCKSDILVQNCKTPLATKQHQNENEAPCRSETNDDGSREFEFPSKNVLKISPNGRTRRIVFHNGDIQENLTQEGVVRYFYADIQAWHETDKDGTQTIRFPDGQKEVLHPSGGREVRFADNSLLQQREDGLMTLESKDGSKLTMHPDGTSTLEMPNGRREVRTKEYTRLEYKDGTVRTKYPSGLLETKYPDGRVRVKDYTGKLIVDTHHPVRDDQIS